MFNLQNTWWQYLIIAVVAYLFGSVNYSIIFSKALRKKDIRTAGSGNAGTTNMFRTFGPLMGILAFACDFLKGFLVSISAYHIAKAQTELFTQQGAEFALVISALFAIIGHIFPIYHRFKGGKGFATFIGFMVALQPLFIALGLLPFFIVLILIDRMSIVSLLTILASLIYVWILYYADNLPLCITVSLISILIFYAHRANIKRIFTGKELPMGIRKYFNPRRKKAVKASGDEQITPNNAEVSTNNQHAEQQTDQPVESTKDNTDNQK